jgi:hypothetical protein
MPKPRHHSWFKFEWNAWRNDPQLRRCSKETRGFWVDAIAVMEELDTYFIEGTVDELCRDLVCTEGEFTRSIAELVRTNAATVVKNQDSVKIISRRILKAHNLTEYNRLKKQEERDKKAVKAMSNDSSKNRVLEKKDKKREESSDTTLSVSPEISTAVAETTPTPPPAPPPVKELPIEIFFGLTLSGLCRRMGVKTLPNPSDWQKHLRWAFANGFSPDDVVECYDHMKQQSWRENAITPKALVAELPNLNDLRSPKPPVPTGRKNGTASGRERSATDSEFGYAAADELERIGLERRAAETQERDRIRRGLLGEGTQDGPEIDLIG